MPGSDVLSDLTPNRAYTPRDLATLMITVSDNAATNLLIDVLGVASVNGLMRRLGLVHTVSERRLERIPAERPRLNRTTAYDMTRLMALIARGEMISVEASRRLAARPRCLLRPCPRSPRMWDKHRRYVWPTRLAA